jgi:hypothetical protein
LQWSYRGPLVLSDVVAKVHMDHKKTTLDLGKAASP